MHSWENNPTRQNAKIMIVGYKNIRVDGFS